MLGVKAFSLEKVLEMEPDFLDEDGEHQHDDTITSVGLRATGRAGTDPDSPRTDAATVDLPWTSRGTAAATTWKIPRTGRAGDDLENSADGPGRLRTSRKLRRRRAAAADGDVEEHEKGPRRRRRRSTWSR